MRRQQRHAAASIPALPQLVAAARRHASTGLPIGTICLPCMLHGSDITMHGNGGHSHTSPSSCFHALPAMLASSARALLGFLGGSVNAGVPSLVRLKAAAHAAAPAAGSLFFPRLRLRAMAASRRPQSQQQIKSEQCCSKFAQDHGQHWHLTGKRSMHAFACPPCIAFVLFDLWRLCTAVAIVWYARFHSIGYNQRRNTCPVWAVWTVCVKRVKCCLVQTNYVLQMIH